MKRTLATLICLHATFTLASAPPRAYEYKAPKVKMYAENTGYCVTPFVSVLGFVWNDKIISNSEICKSPMAAELAFIGVGEDGSQLTTEVLLTDDMFSRILGSARNELRIRQTWGLKTCDGADVSGAISDQSSLEQTIASFRTYNFVQYMSCRYEATKIAGSETDIHLSLPDHGFVLAILDNDDAQISLVGQPEIYFERKTAAVKSAEDAANAAAGSFADIVKGYGVLLVNLNGASTPDRKASLLAYLAQNKQKLLEDLATIDQSLPQCGTMAKFNVNFTIKRGYAFVHNLEAKILGSYPFGDTIGK